MEEDEKLKKLKEELDALEAGAKDYGSPEPEKKESLYRFFRELLYLKDSKKLGNVEKPELGLPDLPVRAAYDIAHFARSQGMDGVANYLDGKGYNTMETSLAKKGFLPQLFVTQIKKDQKISGQQFIEKKGLFGTKQVPVQTAEE